MIYCGQVGKLSHPDRSGLHGRRARILFRYGIAIVRPHISIKPSKGCITLDKVQALIHIRDLNIESPKHMDHLPGRNPALHNIRSIDARGTVDADYSFLYMDFLKTGCRISL